MESHRPMRCSESLVHTALSVFFLLTHAPRSVPVRRVCTFGTKCASMRIWILTLPSRNLQNLVKYQKYSAIKESIVLTTAWQRRVFQLVLHVLLLSCLLMIPNSHFSGDMSTRVAIHLSSHGQRLLPVAM